MDLLTLSFPRQMEADHSAEPVRQLLLAHTTRLWKGSEMDVPVIGLGEPLKKALWRARLQGRVRLGFEDIFEKLISEKKGISLVSQQAQTPYGQRISRLLFFANDGAERFYRQIAQVLLDHSPRLLGCQLDINGDALGQFITGKSGIIKIIMIEHKDAVSDVLRAMVSE